MINRGFVQSAKLIFPGHEGYLSNTPWPTSNVFCFAADVADLNRMVIWLICALGDVTFTKALVYTARQARWQCLP